MSRETTQLATDLERYVTGEDRSDTLLVSVSRQVGEIDLDDPWVGYLEEALASFDPSGGDYLLDEDELVLRFKEVLVDMANRQDGTPE